MRHSPDRITPDAENKSALESDDIPQLGVRILSIWLVADSEHPWVL
jgi:hypothetical protein